MYVGSATTERVNRRSTSQMTRCSCLELDNVRSCITRPDNRNDSEGTQSSLIKFVPEVKG